MLHLAPSVSLLNPPVNYFFLIAAVSLFRSVFSQAQCYFPDGSVELLKTSGSPEGYVPCYPSANVSVCCPQGSKCLSNAVCMSEYDSNYEIIGGLYRASCTDRSWNSSQCPGFCRDSSSVVNGSQAVSSCGNHRWCCQNSSYNSTWCCRGSETSLLPEVTQDAIRVLLSPTAIPRRPDFKSRNILLGVGIGLGLPLALSLTACIWFFLRKRRRRELPPPAIVDGHKDDNARIFELSGHREFELNTGPRSLAVEMSGRTPS